MTRLPGREGGQPLRLEDQPGDNHLPALASRAVAVLRIRQLAGPSDDRPHLRRPQAHARRKAVVLRQTRYRRSRSILQLPVARSRLSQRQRITGRKRRDRTVDLMSAALPPGKAQDHIAGRVFDTDSAATTGTRPPQTGAYWFPDTWYGRTSLRVVSWIIVPLDRSHAVHQSSGANSVPGRWFVRWRTSPPSSAASPMER